MFFTVKNVQDSVLYNCCIRVVYDCGTSIGKCVKKVVKNIGWTVPYRNLSLSLWGAQDKTSQ